MSRRDWPFTVRHVKTDTVLRRVALDTTEAKFLAALADWNREAAGKWIYTSDHRHSEAYKPMPETVDLGKYHKPWRIPLEPELTPHFAAWHRR